MSERAVSPVVGVVLLIAITVALAGSLALTAGTAADLDEPAERAAFELSARADGRIALVHRGGAPLDVRQLRLRIEVDGQRLADQPPVPFFAAEGFRAGPTGPFNPAADPRWTAGERAALRVASTNDPTIAAGSRVRVMLFHDDRPVWEGTTVARAP